MAFKTLLLIFLSLGLSNLVQSQDYYSYIYEAEIQSRSGNIPEAIALYKKADQGHLKAEDAYNLTCLYSRVKDSANAVNSLDHALAQGWGNADWMSTEPDLAYLRSLTIF